MAPRSEPMYCGEPIRTLSVRMLLQAVDPFDGDGLLDWESDATGEIDEWFIPLGARATAIGKRAIELMRAFEARRQSDAFERAHFVCLAITRAATEALREMNEEYDEREAIARGEYREENDER